MSGGEPRPSASSPGEEQGRPMLAARPAPSLVQPSRRRRSGPGRLARVVRAVFRTLPVFSPRWKPCGHHHHHHHHHQQQHNNNKQQQQQQSGASESRRRLAGVSVTGTLFGYRKGRISLCVQESPRCVPSVVVELGIQTQVLLREMSSGMVRIALECEKKADKERSASRLLEEPLWTMFCNGKKTGYGVRRDPADDDLAVMELLRPVSMGAGVLPGRSLTEGPDAEIAYMRANFELVVASRDSETLYMLSPDGNNGPDLTIFFVRI